MVQLHNCILCIFNIISQNGSKNRIQRFRKIKKYSPFKFHINVKYLHVLHSTRTTICKAHMLTQRSRCFINHVENAQYCLKCRLQVDDFFFVYMNVRQKILNIISTRRFNIITRDNIFIVSTARKSLIHIKRAQMDNTRVRHGKHKRRL